MSDAAQLSAPLDQLEAKIADETEPSRRVEALIFGISAAIKAASNDQNVQRLSRELSAAAPRLAAAATQPA